jgi:hypothetical protein
MKTLLGRLGLIGAVLATSAVRASDPVLNRWQHAGLADRSAALSLARKTFDTYVDTHTTITCPANLPPLLHERAGVFVSSMDSRGAPRCCMGTLYPQHVDIAHEIIANAVAAAGADRRFAPVGPATARQIRLIVSIVGPPQPIASPAGLDPVTEGLAVQSGDLFGVVLSGETGRPERAIAWARTRAGAASGAEVRYFRIDDVRMMESAPGSSMPAGPPPAHPG